MNKFAKIIEYLFYLFLFLLPWQTCWIWKQGQLGDGLSQYLSFCLYGTEILLGLILVIAIIYKLFNHDWEISFFNLKVLDFYILFLLILIMAAISVFFSADKNVALYYLLRMAEGFSLLLLILNFKFSFFKTAVAVVLSGVIQAGLAIFQFLTQQVAGNKWLGMAAQLPSTLGVSVVEANGTRWLRAYGSLPHPNILAGFLVICFLMVVILLILTRHKWEKIFLWLALPIILSGLLLAFSKAAFLALGISFFFLIIFIYFSHQKKEKKVLGQIILISLITCSILVIIFPQPFWTRLSGTERLEIKSQQERLDYFNQAKELLKENWLVGIGLGNYTLALYNNGLEKSPSYTYQPVHNVCVLVAVELGALGFFLFALIIIEALRRVWTYKIDEHISLLGIFKLFKFSGVYDFYREKYFWFLGFTSVLIAVLVLMAFDHYFWTLYFGIMLWWLCWGLFVKVIGWVE